MNYRCSIVRVLTLAISLSAGQAFANINYTFSGVTFSGGGGGTLSGTFTTNDAITSLLNYNITTSAGAGGLGFNYTNANSVSLSSLPFILVFDAPDQTTLTNILQVTFNPSLTATGAPITIAPLSSFEQHTIPGGATTARQINAGSAILTPAIPEPETYGMLLAGLGLLGFVARRRKYKTT